MTTKTRGWYWAGICLAALALAAITFLQPATHLEFIGGIDHAWAYGLNMAFHKGWVMGRDIYFTFGPLGFLEHTRVVSLQLLYLSFAFSLIISIAMNMALLHLACLAANGTFARFCNLAIAVAVIVVSFPHMQRLLLLMYALIFLHWLTGHRACLLWLGLCVTLCVLIKFSYGAVALSLWGSYGLLWWWNKRDGRSLLVMIAALLLSYLGVWWLIYGHLQGALGYLQGEFHISRGNAAAMALNPENRWWAILVFYGVLILAALGTHKTAQRQYAWLPLVFLLPLLVWTKYTFSQQETFHMVPIVAFAIWMLALFALVASTFWQKLKLAILVFCAWQAWLAMHTTSVGPPDIRNAPHVTINEPEIFRYRFRFDKLFQVWKKAEQERLAPLVLPDNMRQQIGDANVDIYPWDLTIASINELNWHPRPAFQIYISYLPFLDGKNRDYYNSDQAPAYIIWHNHFYQDVMNRYALSSEPLTVASILNHYQMLGCQGYFCLWKRTEQPRFKPVVESQPQVVHWNQWIRVPKGRGDILRAKIDASRTLAGALNLMVWKEGGIKIDYFLKGGVIKTHDLLIDNATSGVWVAPYIDTYLGSASTLPQEISPQQLKHILSQPLAQGNLEKVETTLMGQRIVGWAGIQGVAHNPEASYVLLFNASKAYLFPVALYGRPDVVGYFSSLGQTMANQCGFDEVINEQLLPEGSYQVRLVVKQGERWAALHDQGVTLQVDAANRQRNEVLQIRLRTSRPWAFADEIQLKWQRLYFLEK